MERVDQRIPARSELAGVHTGVLPAVRREPRLWVCLGVLPFAQIKFQPVHLRRARFHCGRHGSGGRLLNRFFLPLRPQRNAQHQHNRDRRNPDSSHVFHGRSSGNLRAAAPRWPIPGPRIIPPQDAFLNRSVVFVSVRRAAGRVCSGSASRQRENPLPVARPLLCHKPLAFVHPMGRLSGKETAMSIRPVKRLIKSKPTTEGAGVHLQRAFGFGNTSDFDPFLLLDDFRNDVPEDYLAGFPWHPHRGIETITYVLAGTVEHGDSMGNHGAIAAGDVQWMTAGSGIIHQEMPKGDPAGRMHGFQLWANLPSALKMTPPRYQEVKAVEIPEITDDDGTHVRLVCGHFWGKTGPVEGIAADPIYIDVSVPPGKRKTLPIETMRHAFAYVFGGSGKFCNASEPLEVPTEPVGWYGPIVMNTQEQLREAFRELEQGTFLKAHKKAAPFGSASG